MGARGGAETQQKLDGFAGSTASTLAAGICRVWDVDPAGGRTFGSGFAGVLGRMLHKSLQGSPDRIGTG
jgi:hypothetical protein